MPDDVGWLQPQVGERNPVKGRSFAGTVYLRLPCLWVNQPLGFPEKAGAAGGEPHVNEPGDVLFVVVLSWRCITAELIGLQKIAACSIVFVLQAFFDEKVNNDSYLFGRFITACQIKRCVPGRKFLGRSILLFALEEMSENRRHPYVSS